jgi:hypothetical protein
VLKAKVKGKNDNKKIQKIESNAPQDKKNMKKDDTDSKSVVNVKGSSDKKTKKKNAVAKEVNKIAINVDSTESSSQESELMKQINAADLKQKLAQTINQSMTIRNNAKHLEVHVSGPF